ncbi:MAG: hypothetical protein ACKO2G_02335 [Verrucomicrobiales bacterium]
MKTRLCLFLLAGAALSAAEPDWIDEGFEVPRVYQDGQTVAGVEKTADGAGGWVMDDKIKAPLPDAFVASASVAEKPEDPKAARERERQEKDALREAEKDLDRDARKKAEEARETAAKAAKVAASLKTRPGQLTLVPGKPGGQSIVRTLSEPIKAPFYMLVVLETDYSAGGFSISLEDEIVDLPFELKIQKLEERHWKLSAGGSAGGVSCKEVKGRHVFLAGMEPDPKSRENWLVRAVCNPTDLRNPLAGVAGVAKFSTTVPFKDFVRLRISRGEKFSGKIDEIRFGKTLRDVLP